VAALLVVFVLSATTNTAPAYALTQNGDGTVTFTLNDLSTGIPALNARLTELGIRETVVPIQAGCQAHSFEPLAAPGASMSESITVGNKWIPAGYQGFMAAKQLPNGKIAMAIGTTQQPIPSCFPDVSATSFPASN